MRQRIGAAGIARSYDANGNTTARGSESLFYGDHNRLVSRSGAFGMSSASYQHNARGERVWKQSMAGVYGLGSGRHRFWPCQSRMSYRIVKHVLHRKMQEAQRW